MCEGLRAGRCYRLIYRRQGVWGQSQGVLSWKYDPSSIGALIWYTYKIKLIRRSQWMCARNNEWMRSWGHVCNPFCKLGLHRFWLNTHSVTCINPRIYDPAVNESCGSLHLHRNLEETENSLYIPLGKVGKSALLAGTVWFDSISLVAAPILWYDVWKWKQCEIFGAARGIRIDKLE